MGEGLGACRIPQGGQFGLRSGQRGREQPVGLPQFGRGPLHGPDEDGGLGDGALGGTQVPGRLLGVARVVRLTGLVEPDGGEHQPVLGLFDVPGDGGARRGRVPLTQLAEDRLGRGRPPGQLPEPRLRDRQRLTHPLLQPPQSPEAVRRRVQAPFGLGAPPDDPGECLPTGHRILRYAVVVALPHPERGGQFPLGLAQRIGEGRHRLRAEQLPWKPEFVAGGPDPVVGGDEAVRARSSGTPGSVRGGEGVLPPGVVRVRARRTRRR
ncbi:hypothetical protein [Streptomyces phaeoluteigriseus]|uniref:hypothetical protein n=1 Tax=Streptomyces phaeoluteigriseus TaxID=114686 RepID=UPI001FE4F58C|nr:hypothetical protein [Streptomyces phaeoluteigriseus]